MTTVEADTTTTDPPAHPRSRTASGWRARLAVMASRGEIDGPRVAEAKAALSWHRARRFMVREMGIAAEHVDALLDEADQAEAAVAKAAAKAVAQ